MEDDGDYNQRQLIGKVAETAFSDVTDSIIDTRSAMIVLSISMTLEICGLGMMYISRDKVVAALDESGSRVWAYTSAAVFAVGFINAFAIYSLIANKWPHRGSGLNNWLVSIIAATLNVLLFLALTTSMLH